MNIPFNINDCVLVKLNDVGRNIHRSAYEKYATKSYPYAGPAVDDNGYTRFQLWDLMKLFGPHISLGAVPPFDTEIIFEAK